MPRFIRMTRVLLVTPRFCRFAAVAAMTLAVSVYQSQAAEPATKATAPAASSQADKPIVRVYDIRDLLVDLGGEVTQPPVWTPAATSKPATQTQPATGQESNQWSNLEGRRQKALDSIAKQIKENVDPASWDPEKKDGGAIRYLSGNLVISQTAANHEKILAIIQAARKERTVSILILAKVISVPANDDKKVRDLLTELKSPLDEKSSTALMSPNSYNKLIDRLEGDKFNVLTVPKAMLLNDQLAVMSSGNLENSSLPMDSKSVEMVFHGGSSLAVRAHVTADGEFLLQAMLTCAQVGEKLPSYSVAQGKLSVKLAADQAVILRLPMESVKAESVKESVDREGKKSYDVVAKPQLAEPASYIYLTIKPTVILPLEIELPASIEREQWRKVSVRREDPATLPASDHF